MAARPRVYKRYEPNLYQKTDKRNGKTYFTYKHPITGKFIGLGCDRDKAFELARQANVLISEQRFEQLKFSIHPNSRAVKDIGISAIQWTKKYIRIQNDRLKKGELRPETIRTNIYLAGLFSERFKHTGIKDITTKDIAHVLDEYKSRGKDGMARNIRNSWKNMYIEAQYAGEVDSNFNPVASTRCVKVTSRRKRINESDLIEIMGTELYKFRYYLRMAIKLAITTGLRRGDIVNLKFSNVKGDHLFVALSKSGGKTKLAFPLEMTNPFLNQPLGDIIKECRSSRITSKYLIHSSKNTGHAKRGHKISVYTLSKSFKAAKMECSPKVASSSFSFHELRSFAERTYRDAGYDTKVLLGHKHQSMTDKYNDDRSDDYVYIVIPTDCK